MVALEKDEIIITEVRKHWYFVLVQLIGSVLAAVIPVFLAVGMYGRVEHTDAIARTYAIGLALYPLWLLGIWISVFVFWTDYYLDVLVITNKRVIEIEQIGMFSRNVSTFPLQNIQDITIGVHGMLATILDFGDIQIQTAGEREEFIVNNISHPEAVKKALSDAHDRIIADNPIKTI